MFNFLSSQEQILTVGEYREPVKTSQTHAVESIIKDFVGEACRDNAVHKVHLN